MFVGHSSLPVGTTFMQSASSRTRSNAEVLTPPPPPAAPAAWPATANAAAPASCSAPAPADGAASPFLTSYNLPPQSTAMPSKASRMQYQPAPAVQTLTLAPSCRQAQLLAAQQYPGYAGDVAQARETAAYGTL